MLLESHSGSPYLCLQAEVLPNFFPSSHRASGLMLKSLILLELIYACWETRIYHITLCVETQVSSIICGRCSLFSSVDFCYLKVLNVFSHQRNENWNYFKIPPSSQSEWLSQGIQNATNETVDVGGGEFLDNIDRSVNLAVIWKSGWRLFKKKTWNGHLTQLSHSWGYGQRTFYSPMETLGYHVHCFLIHNS